MLESIREIFMRELDAPELPENGDYSGADGLLYCGRCNTRKQYRQSVLGIVPIMCKCREEAVESEKARMLENERIYRVQKLRDAGIYDRRLWSYTFTRDLSPERKESRLCREYVDMWEDNFAKNRGILFTGDVGTGKTYLACCVANALIEKGVNAGVTNMPHVLDALSDFKTSRADYIGNLCSHDLLVIDDLGVERNNEYANEKVYGVIDARSRSGRPLIVTTNLTLDEMERPRDMVYRRIYGRVLEMCTMRLAMPSENYRAVVAAQKREEGTRDIRAYRESGK